MILANLVLVLLCSTYSTAQTSKKFDITDLGDDASNWNTVWKQNQALGRSDSGPLSVFDRILKANAEARRQGTARGASDPDFLFQGDIVMEKREAVDLLNEKTERPKRAVMRKFSSRLWKPKISYTLSRGLSSRAKEAIRRAIKEWEKTLPCLGSWKEIVDSSRNKPKDYIRFIKGRGCYSKVGRIGGRQSISIGRGCEYTGIVIHEIGHAMGFWHEQSRTDRDNHVSILWNNILPTMKFNFQKYSSSRINDLGVSYDYGSVMHYGPKAFSKDGSATIRPKVTGARLGQRYGLSKKDKEQAKLLYSCKGTVVSSCKDTNSRCPAWGKQGYCDPAKGYESYMKINCCGTCQSTKDVCKSSPCLNGGSCSSQGDDFKCKCRSGYSGKRCELKSSPKPCDSSPCLNGGACRNRGNSFACSCQKLYKGDRCEKRRPCYYSPCLNGGQCSDQGNRVTCRCKAGYTGIRCQQKKCEDTIASCKRWTSHCEKNSKYYSFMETNCCRTCRQSVCSDKIRYCGSWKNFCKSKRFGSFMRSNCKKTCGIRC